MRFLAPLAALAALAAGCLGGSDVQDARETAPERRLEQAVTVDALFEHLAELQGFEFLYSREARPTRLEEVSPARKELERGEDFLTLEYSGSGDVSAPVATVGPAEASGCRPDDFDGFPAGDIALLVRGGCFFFDKVDNAERAGASAVLVMNDGSPGHEGPIGATLVRPAIDIPALGLSHA